MGLACLEGETQGLAGADQMVLADDFVDEGRAQAFGEGNVAGVCRRFADSPGGRDAGAEQVGGAVVSDRPGCPRPWAG